VSRLLALLLLAGACREASDPEASLRPRREPAAEAPPAARPLPPEAADGAIGRAGPVTLVVTAEDGGWVALCQGASLRRGMALVVGAGAGLPADRLIAGSDRDVVVIDGDHLVHVDIVARTWRRLGPAGPAAIDAERRRIVHARGDRLIVRDPGQAPREIGAAGPVATILLRGGRWAEITTGPVPGVLLRGSCGQPYVRPDAEKQATIDLDPVGVEAVDRVGPAIGVTAAGEVTLDGEVVADAACSGYVMAALAEPPRVLVACQLAGIYVVGPDLRAQVGGHVRHVGPAAIAEPLTLGHRLICVSGACVDLVAGVSYDTGEHALVWADDETLVRIDGTGLRIDQLGGGHAVVPLPHVTREITIDAATGRRIAGPAPRPPTWIGAAGRFGLYGRHLLDVRAGRLVATLGTDTLAVDRGGRVLVPASPGHGPLRWLAPAQAAAPPP
jgi:hypothetical protein